MLAGHRPGGQPQPPPGFAQVVVHMRHAVGRGSGAHGADDGRPVASYAHPAQQAEQESQAAPALRPPTSRLV